MSRYALGVAFWIFGAAFFWASFRHPNDPSGWWAWPLFVSLAIACFGGARWVFRAVPNR